MDINYFDFLKMFPEIIDTKDLPPVDLSYYVDYVKSMHEFSTKKPLIQLHNLSDLVLKAKETNDEKYDILRGYLRVKIDNDSIIVLKHTEDLNNFEISDSNEMKGHFNISVPLQSLLHLKYYYFNKEEMKNMKRTLLINKCLDEKYS